MVSPLKEIISEKDFLEIFQKQTSEIMKICSYLNEKVMEDSLFTKRFTGTSPPRPESWRISWTTMAPRTTGPGFTSGSWSPQHDTWDTAPT